MHPAGHRLVQRLVGRGMPAARVGPDAGKRALVQGPAGQQHAARRRRTGSRRRPDAAGWTRDGPRDLGAEPMRAAVVVEKDDQSRRCRRSSCRAFVAADRSGWVPNVRRRVAMAVVLAYTAPAIGHLFPFCALLDETGRARARVHVRTLASGVELCLGMGFTAEAVDPRIEALQSAHAARRCACSGRAGDGADVDRPGRAARSRLRRAVRGGQSRCDPRGRELLGRDVGRRGAAATVAGASLRSSRTCAQPGSPPFGAGAAPWRGPLGGVRDLGIGSVNPYVFDRPFAPG